MRRLRLILLLCLVCPLLQGCAVTGEVENQAYALVMGVDGAADGGIELTIRIPRIGQSGAGDAESGGKDAPYLVIAASGTDYPQALENLQWAVARELNLSHLNLLVVSEALASEARFPALLRQVAETRHLYATAGLIVCEGRARAFIEGQETLLGSHLSSDIDAMFRHYLAHGYIPGATLADLYYATLSCYSDPVGILGFPDSGEKPAASILEADEDKLNAQTLTASSRQYLGTALFREGRLIGRLDAGETLGLNLLKRRVDSFSFSSGGRAWSLSCVRPPRIRVTADGDRLRIRADIYLTCAEPGDTAALEAGIARSLEAVMAKCQSLSVEPFGFAVKAAARFPTLDAWRAYDWRGRFPEAACEADIHISGPQ